MNDFKMKELAEAKSVLISAFKSQIANIESADTKELGEVADMIKDLADAEKNCYEACYYKTVIEAMEDGKEDRYGYSMPRTNYRMSGSGHMGYKPMIDQEPYINGYLHDPNFKDNMYDRSDRYGYIKPENMNNAMNSIKSMWNGSDPEMRMQLKRELSTMLGDLE